MAPRVSMERTKVLWDEEGLEAYKSYLEETLPSLLHLVDTSSESLFEILLDSAFFAFNLAAGSCFRTRNLNAERKRIYRLNHRVREIQNAVRDQMSLLWQLRQSDNPDGGLIESHRQALRSLSNSLKIKVR